MLSFVLLAVMSSVPTAAGELVDGRWDAWLECPGGPLRFGLELAGSDDGWQAWLVNGAERTPVPRVTFNGRTLGLHIEHYDALVAAHFVPGEAGPSRLVGEWSKRTGADAWARLPFEAAAPRAQGTPERDGGSDVASPVDGRWRVDFESDEQPAVAVFESVDGELRGTVLTTTGDYRYLAGRCEGGTLTLSSFDGAHAFLIVAALQSDGSLAGDFWSRDTWHETFTAVRDDEVRLPDGFSLTRWTEQGSLADLVFPDLQGVPRSLEDPAFAGRARILQVFGSWCPNRHDASELLVELDRRYRDQGLSIVGLAFEVTGDGARDSEQVRRYAERHGVTWPLLVAGLSDKAAASAALPVLDEVRSFPTTIFLHGDGRVRAVYQGFSGPATGKDHEVLRAAFVALIEELLAEAPAG